MPCIKEKVDFIRPLTKIKYFIWLIFGHYNIKKKINQVPLYIFYKYMAIVDFLSYERGGFYVEIFAKFLEIVFAYIARQDIFAAVLVAEKIIVFERIVKKFSDFLERNFRYQIVENIFLSEVDLHVNEIGLIHPLDCDSDH